MSSSRSRQNGAISGRSKLPKDLKKAQIPGALEGAQRLAQGGAVTRGHFARFLVECGKASSMADVFKKYLARGKTGYVPPQWLAE